MPARGSIEKLPIIARDLINRTLRENNFSGYVELAERFKRLGKGVSKSALHRHAQKLKAFEERARFEAEVMANMGEDASFLVRWARSEPKAAARLVKRLREQQQGAKG